MTTFETSVVVIGVIIALLLYAVVAALDSISKELKEVWRRMPRID